MLDYIRKRRRNIVTTLIVGAVVAVMAISGIGGSQMGGGLMGGDGTAAWVNGERITQRDFQMELENKVAQFQGLFGAQYDEKFLYELQIPQRTLDELIQFKLLAQQSRQLNILVPDTELADYIRSQPYFQKNGKFDAEGYSKMANVGLMEKRQRERLLWSKFQSYLTDRVRMTPDAIRRAYELRETKVDLAVAKINLDEIAAQKTATREEVAAFTKGASDETYKQYYDGHKDDFVQKASVQLRQIRVGVPYKANEAQKAEAKKKAEALAKTVTPENFAAMAKKSSDDEFASKGGQVGWITRGTLEPPLEAALDQLQPGVVSSPIETSFGYFLLLVEDKKPEVVQTLEQAKPKIAETLASEKTRKEYADGLRKKWEEILAAGKPLEPELAKLKIAVKKTGPFSLGQGYLPNIGQSDAMLDAVFALSPKEPVSNKLHYHQNHYYYLKLASVERPKAEEFEKQADVVEKSVATSLQSELMSQWVAKLKKQSSVKRELNLPEGPANAE
jgi:peptidyl-prolyl cis-trans isomerase D